MIQKPKEKNKPYIITLKSEEELVQSAESRIKFLLYGSVLCFFLGAAAIIYRFINPN